MRRWRRRTLVDQPWMRLEVAVRHTAAAVVAAGRRNVCW